MNKTQRWMKANGVIGADATGAGIMPQQIERRRQRAVATLLHYGHKGSELYSALSVKRRNS